MNFDSRKRIIYLPLLGAFVFLLIFLASYQIAKKPLARVSFSERCLEVLVELAVTPEEHQQGLMYRQKMGINQGMLFVFEEEEKRSFWMKNTNIPLDIIFLSADQKIVDIKESFQPCVIEQCPAYESSAPARYVLELNAGLSWQKGLKIGDKAEIKLK